jgi:hypothetical protein
MFKNVLIILRRRLFVSGSATALATACLGGSGALAADPDKAVDAINTATPIKHVLIIVGENRSFDHLYATYVPKNRDERVLNLLSERIINADGSPGRNFAKAQQYQVTSAPNSGKYFVGVDLKNKSLYNVLPAPDIDRVQNPPGAGALLIPGGDPGLPSQSEFLLGTGGTGLAVTLSPDTRITNVTALPPGPFQPIRRCRMTPIRATLSISSSKCISRWIAPSIVSMCRATIRPVACTICNRQSRRLTRRR